MLKTGLPVGPGHDQRRSTSSAVPSSRLKRTIGARSVILPGIRIGTRALVGAGSVVTRDVDAEMLVRGNPARPAGRRDELPCTIGRYERAYAWETAS